MASRHGKPLRSDGRQRRLRLETLEDRRMLAVATVDTELDVVDINDGLTSLREAIFAANTISGADTIEFDPSLAGKTILLTQGELLISDDLTINGLGQDLLTIDASGSDATPGVVDGMGSRVFNISDNDSGNILNVALFGLTITGGDPGGSGGGISSAESLTITDSTITGNAANVDIDAQHSGHGGGVYSEGNLTIANSVISGNSVGDDEILFLYRNGGGGGIWTEGTTFISGSTITLNKAGNGSTNPNPDRPGYTFGTRGGDGGGILSNGLLTITNSTISNNSAGRGGDGFSFAGMGGSGGGINATGTLSVNHTSITGNTSGEAGSVGLYGDAADGGSGGGIWILGELYLGQSKVSGNATGNGTRQNYVSSAVAGHGGGIAVTTFGYRNATIIDSTISDNRTGTHDFSSMFLGSSNKGGGISFESSDIFGTHTIINSTISGNRTGNGGPGGQSGGGGGGLSFDGPATKNIINSTISGNITGRGGSDDWKLWDIGDGR